MRPPPTEEIVDAPEKPRFLIWGARGWIAGHLQQYLLDRGKDVHTTTVPTESRINVFATIRRVQPTHVLNAAGCIGRPNVDWSEVHKEETVRSNVIGTLNVADACLKLGVHCTVFGTGCIYHYDTDHPLGGPGFLETDHQNYFSSFYSLTKGHTQDILKHYTNCLVLRIRMPVSDDLHPRSFVTKMTNYERVVDIPNSHTMLSDMLPAAVLLAENRETGVYNFTNPGVISHNQVLTLFKEFINPEFTWTNISLGEQAQVIKAGRSNCALDTTKLEDKLKEYGCEVPDIYTAYRNCFGRLSDSMKTSTCGKDKLNGKES